MASTEPKTYRVSKEVDSELRCLAKIHGGVNKALLALFGQEPVVQTATGAMIQERNERPAALDRALHAIRSPLLKPGEKKKAAKGETK